MKHTWLNCWVSFLFTFKLMKNAFHSFYLWDVVCICVCVCIIIMDLSKRERCTFLSFYNLAGRDDIVSREFHILCITDFDWRAVLGLPVRMKEKKTIECLNSCIYLILSHSHEVNGGCVLCVSVRHCVNRIRKRFLESGEGRNTNFFLVPSKLKRIRIGFNQIETNMRIEKKIMRDHITIF